MVGEPAFYGGGLVGGEREDVREPATGENDSLARLLGCCDAGIRHYLRRADGGHVGTCGREGRIELAAGAIVVGAVGADALVKVARHAVVARGVEEGRALEAEFHVLVALALLVESGQVGFVVAVGGADDLCGSEAAASFGPFVAAWEWIGVDAVLGWVVSTFVTAVAAVNGVKEVVEGGTFDDIAGLVKCYWLRIDERHGVFKIEVGFAIESETSICSLDDGTIDEISGRGTLDLVCREIGEEKVEVALQEGLWCVLHDAVNDRSDGLAIFLAASW